MLFVICLYALWVQNVVVLPLFPAVEVFFYFRELAAVEYGLFDAIAFLLTVVFEQTEDVFAKAGDGYEVTCGDECHEQVAETPYYFKTEESTEHDEHSTGKNASHVDDNRIVGHETYV